MALSAALKAKSQPQVIALTITVGDTIYLTGPVTADGATQDFTGCTCTAQIKASDAGAVLLTFTCSVPTPLSGVVLLALTPAQTATLTPTSDGAQVGVWGAQITDGTDVVTFVRGDVFAQFDRI